MTSFALTVQFTSLSIFRWIIIVIINVRLQPSIRNKRDFAASKDHQAKRALKARQNFSTQVQSFKPKRRRLSAVALGS